MLYCLKSFIYWSSPCIPRCIGYIQLNSIIFRLLFFRTGFRLVLRRFLSFSQCNSLALYIYVHSCLFHCLYSPINHHYPIICLIIVCAFTWKLIPFAGLSTCHFSWVSLETVIAIKNTQEYIFWNMSVIPE